MSILCLGINHRTAPLAVRERLAFPKAEVPEAVQALRRLPGVQEIVLLSTCNRVEVYAVATDASRQRAAVIKFLQKARKIPAATFTRAAYQHDDIEAVRHLTDVAAGLDSQVVGEGQIVGQVREAHATALAAGATGTVLNGLFNRALATAKRVRTETEIGRLPASVGSVAVDLAGRIFGELTGRTVLLLGTGETAVIVAEHLMEDGSPRLLVAGEKHLDRAEALAARFGGEALRLSDAHARLDEADVVIVATASTGYVVNRDQVTAALHRRKARPMFLVDLSVPRNIDPDVANLANAYLYNLDDLKAAAGENLKRREAWIAPGRAIVAEGVSQTKAWLDSLEVVPMVVALQAYGEVVRKEVLDRAGKRVRDLPPETRAEVEYLTQAIVNKLLHRPISELKSMAGNGSVPLADFIRKLFKLE
jgi:glutamyl-tRNA reductase